MSRRGSVGVTEIPTPTARFVGEQTLEQVRATYQLLAEYGRTAIQRRKAREQLERLAKTP